MKEAKIFIAQDDQGTLRLLRALLEDSGHVVVATASTFTEAEVIIPTLKRLGVTVAVLDANLKEGEILGTDGRIMTSLIRKSDPNIKIIGISGKKFPVKVDVDLGAEKMIQLPKVIDGLK